MSTDEPAVLSWHLAMAPRPRPEPRGHHWWREYVQQAWRAAYDAWCAEREAVAVGYATEMAEFEAENPCPRFGDFLVHLARGADPAEVLR